MFNYIKDKLKSVNQYFKDGLTNFIKEPAVAASQAAAEAGVKKLKSELSTAAVEVAEAFSHKAEDTARFIANDTIKSAGHRLRNTFAATNTPTTLDSDFSSAQANKINIVTAFLRAVYIFITEIFYKFISRLMTSLLTINSPQTIAAPATTIPVAEPLLTPNNNANSSPTLASVTTEQNLNAVRTLVSNLLPVAMQAFNNANATQPTTQAQQHTAENLATQIKP